MPTSVVRVGKKKCKPFLLEVMVMSPESGFKFEIVVERNCTKENDPIWKLVFDLYKEIEEEFVQIVHVSYKAKDPSEEESIESMAVKGVSVGQAKVLVEEVHPAAKKLEGVSTPTDEQKRELAKAMKNVVNADV